MGIFDFLKKKNKEVLGWQFSGLYLGGDPHNEKQAPIYVRILEKGLVFRGTDGEEDFSAMFLPYEILNDVYIKGEGADNSIKYSILDNKSPKAVFNILIVDYKDSGENISLKIKPVLSADVKQNSKGCEKIIETIKHMKEFGRM